MHESTIVQQKVTTTENKKQESINRIRLYRGVYVNREGLKSLLEVVFTRYGMKEKIPEAEYTIEHESSWIWNNGNGISIGLAAFTRATWKENCVGEYEDMNPLDQLSCFTKLWAKGEQWRWDTWCGKYGAENKHCIMRGF